MLSAKGESSMSRLLTEEECLKSIENSVMQRISNQTGLTLAKRYKNQRKKLKQIERKKGEGDR